ncbi:MAG: enoyl-CoA hydratase [Sneathiella sp.]|jgi:2-(1,2-epoxy-1,2-dihydrophenyl)acetyl-CoA isomerase|uniref:enoyl-CoA hydratase-related protein n=1 Tax=Sneathiella sp. TaxID=1964365 RepID=UPI000C50B184|nr:enoyl-CoA hydratase-related protein [Sneathiella sp.]MAL80797.1 enoyl-CoA hydratase [Sneathiella sp.]
MSSLLQETNGNLLKITLNRPDQMNAMSADMIQDLTRIVLDVTAKRTAARAILITGSGRGFCAGADLQGDGLASRRKVIEGQMMAGVNRLILAIRETPVPVIIALNGAAAGAGCGLALSGDIIIAAKSAKLLTAFSRIGAVLDGGMSWSLVHKLGTARAMGMALFGEQAIDAETAKDWGLIWDVVEDDQLMDKASEMAHRLANGPTVALGLIKREIAFAQSNSLADALRFEAACQGQAFLSDDFPEGVKAFQEKRPAQFKGE